MKDNFSTRSDLYARYRPHYPTELFLYLETLLARRHRAWDCGTGNGQVAAALAADFEEVEATDISEPQLENAIRLPNINYSRQPAEQTSFPEAHFDLVTVAQAVHWFDLGKFFKEVQRTLKPGGVVAVLGYGLVRSNEATNSLIDHFYHEIVGPYWDEERKYLENEYQTIPFPFEEVRPPFFSIEENWDLEHLAGYLRTWSAVKHYEKDQREDPVDLVFPELKKAFGTRKAISFPVLLRVGRYC